MAAFALELSLRVRNVTPEEAATGIRASIQEHYEPDNSYIEVTHTVVLFDHRVTEFLVLTPSDLPMGTFSYDTLFDKFHRAANQHIWKLVALLRPAELKIAQTETVIGQTNVTFQHRCSLNYRFDKLERLKVSVYCVKDDTGAFLHRIGEVYTDVATVMANKGTLSLPLSPSAAIDIYITVPDFYAHYVKLKFRGTHLQVREHVPLAPYMILVLRIEKRTILLYKSEVVKEKNPKWAEFAVPIYVIQFFTHGALQIHVYNQNTNAADTLIGFCSTSMAQLERGVGALNSYMLMNFEGKRIHEKMSVELESMELGRGQTFFSAIKDSTHLHLTTAIDMTASNGNPNQPDSLHFIHPHAQSPYVNAMLRLTPLFLGYMAHSRIGALGFGARTEPRFELSQCFALSGSHTDPHVDGVKGLLEAYRSAMMAVQPFAPTDFSEVIYHVSKFAKAETRRRLGLYFVLLILTDGGLTNPRRTIDAIVDCSLHPMSVIAVGIGKDREFASVKALESPVLKHSDGRPLARQNFQFVPFEDLDSDDAVALIPLQIAQWRNLVCEKPMESPP